MITNESSGVIVGHGVFNGNFKQNGVVLVPDEGDIAPAINDSTLTLPQLSRPDGTKVSSEPQSFSVTTPMSASSDAGRDSNVGIGASVASVASVSGGVSVDSPTSVAAPTSAGSATPVINETAVANTTRGGSPVTVTPQSTRVGGTKLVATPRTAAYSLPVSSSNAARRDSSYSEQAEKRLAQRGAAKLMLQRSSFFGMRGGNTALAKR